MRIPTVTQFDNQLNTLADQMQSLQMLQYQSNGSKIQNSSDDPVLADQIKAIGDYIKSIDNYDISGKLAQNRSSIFSSSLQTCIDMMVKVRELTQYAQSDTLSNEDRLHIAEQLKGYLQRMVQVGNTQDGNGNYIYSGYATSTPPFVQLNGVYQYQGSMDSTTVDIGVNISTVYNDCGNSVFGSIPNGNGTFTVTAPSSNTGTAYTTAGSVFSTAAYVADTYTISFVNNGGQTAYTIVGATSGQVVPAPPGTIPGDAPIFNPNMDLSFNGVSLHISGTPHVGDSFVIAPSNNDNVFNMLQDLITTLSTPVDATVPSQQAAMHQQLTQCSSSLYQASAQLRSYLSQVGTRGADIDTQVQLNGKTMTQQKEILGKLADSDQAAVFSNISQKNVEIQTTAGVYMKIQSMLFDLMKSMML